MDMPALLKAVMRGEEVVITDGGVPMARLAALETRRSRYRLGLLSGRFEVPDDWDAPLPPDVEAAFTTPATPSDGVQPHEVLRPSR